MKKLVIAFAAVAMAAAVQAASVDWKVNGATATDGYTVLLFTADPGSSYASIDALKQAAVSSGTIAKAGRDYVAGPVSVTDDAVTKTATYYFAIFSGDNAKSYNYVEAVDMKDYVYSSTESGLLYAKVKAADILGGKSGEIGSPEPTPEPTSAMLMLLGVAGLALRRKQK